MTDSQVGMFLHHKRNHEKQDLNEALFDETRKLGIEQVLQNFENDQPGQQVVRERSPLSPRRRPLESIPRPNASVTEVSASAATPFLGLVQALDHVESRPTSTPNASNKRPYTAS